MQIFIVVSVSHQIFLMRKILDSASRSQDEGAREKSPFRYELRFHSVVAFKQAPRLAIVRRAGRNWSGGSSATTLKFRRRAQVLFYAGAAARQLVRF
jgi:hypothetical protein